MSATSSRTVLVIGGISRSLVNFRGPLLKSLADSGYRVHAAAGEPDDAATARLNEWGISFHPLPLSRAGLNPVRDLALLIRLIRLIRRVKPDVMLCYTIKAVIYGGWAARWRRVPERHALITGRGYALADRGGTLACLVRGMYRSALKGCRTVFFQNPDDRAFFCDHGLIDPERAALVNGSGVDLDFFEPAPLPDKPAFLMIARLLADKGVREYVLAAERIMGRHPDARFMLVGGLDANPNAIREDELRAWQASGVIEYRGHLKDVRPALRECRVYVLPSYYREGLPRTILEAMAMGRPVITTDEPGCRETVPLTAGGRRRKSAGEPVMEGENGFLITSRNVDALESAMQRFIDAPASAIAMGRRSREMAEAVYDVRNVNDAMRSAMGLKQE